MGDDMHRFLVKGLPVIGNKKHGQGPRVKNSVCFSFAQSITTMCLKSCFFAATSQQGGNMFLEDKVQQVIDRVLGKGIGRMHSFSGICQNRLGNRLFLVFVSMLSLFGFISQSHAYSPGCNPYDLAVTKVQILNPTRVFRRGDVVKMRVTLTNVGTLNQSDGIIRGTQIGTSIDIQSEGGRSVLFIPPRLSTATIPAGASRTFDGSFTVTNFNSQVLVRHMTAIIGMSQEGGAGGCSSMDFNIMGANGQFTDPIPYKIFPTDKVTTTATPDVKNSGTTNDPINTFTGELFKS